MILFADSAFGYYGAPFDNITSIVCTIVPSCYASGGYSWMAALSIAGTFFWALISAVIMHTTPPVFMVPAIRAGQSRQQYAQLEERAQAPIQV